VPTCGQGKSVRVYRLTTFMLFCSKWTERHINFELIKTYLFGEINKVVGLINKKELQSTSSVIEISQVKFS
jgi:hypothetical protein